MIITHADMRSLNYCNRVPRRFCKQHGIDWNDFRKNGIEAEQLIATGDAQAIKLVETVRGRQQ